MEVIFKKNLMKVDCLSKTSIYSHLPSDRKKYSSVLFFIINYVRFTLTVSWINTSEGDLIKDHMFRAVGQASFNPSHEKKNENEKSLRYFLKNCIYYICNPVIFFLKFFYFLCQALRRALFVTTSSYLIL